MKWGETIKELEQALNDSTKLLFDINILYPAETLKKQHKRNIDLLCKVSK
jgi:hypothetical protein